MDTLRKPLGCYQVDLDTLAAALKDTLERALYFGWSPREQGEAVAAAVMDAIEATPQGILTGPPSRATFIGDCAA